MANPIQNNQIADENIFKALAEGGENLIRVIDQLTQQAKEFAVASEKIMENLDFSKTKDLETLNAMLETLEKVTNTVIDAQEKRREETVKLTKQEKQLAKLNQEQAESTQELAVSIEQVRLQRAQERKAAKEIAKDNLNLTTTYDRQRKRLNELTKSLINARLEGTELTKQNQRDQKEFIELQQAIKEAEEEFGRFQRNVGNYPNDANRATRATERLSRQLARLQAGAIAIGGIAAGGGLLGGFLNRTQEGFEGLRIATEAFDSGVNQLIGPTLKGFVKGFKQADKSVDDTTSTLTTALFPGLKAVSEQFKEAGEEASGLEKIVSGLKEGVVGLEEGLEGLGPAVEQQLILSQELLEFERTLRSTIQARNVEGSELGNLDVIPGLLEQAASQAFQLEKELAIADRNTLSFAERLEAVDAATKLAFGTSEELADELRDEVLVQYDKILDRVRQLPEGSNEQKEAIEELTVVSERLSDIEESRNAVFVLRAKILDDEIAIVKERLAITQAAGANAIALEERFTQLQTERIQLQNEQTQLVLQLSEVRLQLLQDQTEQELDILIDSFDTQRTINERLIQSDRTTFEERNRLIQANRDLATASFEAQIDALVELENQRRFAGVVSEENTKALEEFRKEILRFVDATATEQQAILEQLQLSEQIGTRAIEISRERRIVELELLEVQREAAELEGEADLQLKNIQAREKALGELSQTTLLEGNKRKRINEQLQADELANEIEFLEAQLQQIESFNDKQIAVSQKSIMEGQELVSQVLEERAKSEQELIENDEEIARQRLIIADETATEEQRLEAETALKKAELLDQELQAELNQQNKSIEQTLDQIKREEDIISESSQKELDLREDLNDALIDSDQMAFERRQEQFNQFIEDLEQGFNIADAFLDELSEKRIAKIDEQISAVDRREQELREALASGSEIAGESLAELDKRRSELANARERELLNQARTELAISTIQAFSSNVNNPDVQNPLQRTIVDVLALREFWKSIPLFFHGTDDTGTARNPLDPNGGRIAMLHDNEQIWSKSDRAEVNFRSRDEIKEAVKLADYVNDTGGVVAINPLTDSAIPQVVMDLSPIKEVKKAIDKLPEKMPRHRTDWNKVTGIATDVWESKTKRENLHRRLGGFYG